MGADFVGGAGNDTFTGNDAAGVIALTSLDSIDGGAGTGDTLNITTILAINTTTPVGYAVKGIENVNLVSAAGVTANTTTSNWSGVTAINAVGGDNMAITAATTTDVVVSASTLTAGAGTELGVEGGKNVTTTSADSVTGGAAVASSTIVIGGTTAPTGAVSITHTETTVDNAAAGADTSTTSTINVTGGTTVAINSLVTAGVAQNAGDISTIGAIGVTGTAVTTSVSVTQSAATAVFAAAGDKIQILNGAVTIADVNAASATAAGTIATVSLTNFGNSTVNSSALTSVTLGGTGGTFGIGRGALTAVPTANTLALNTNTLTGTNTITDTEAGADTDDGFTTINLTNTGTTVIADLVAADLTTLNISGSGSLRLTANTLGGATTTAITNTSTGSVTLGGALAVGTTYTGGVGADTISVGATTKSITTGEGDDVVTFSAAAVGTGGSIAAGAGTGDTLSMTSANAATASSTAALGTAFTTTVTGFEKLVVTGGGTNTVNVARLGGFTDISTAGDTALTLDGVTTGSTLRLTATGTAQTVNSTAALQTSLTDSLNLVLTGVLTADVAFSTTGLTATDVETINVTSSYASSMTAAQIAAAPAGGFENGMILLGNQVKTIVVGGEAGLNLTAASTGLTSLDASSNTVGSAGNFSWTSGATTAAVTVKGLASGINTIVLDAATVAGTYTGSADADNLSICNALANVLNLGNGANTVIGTASGNNVVTGGSGADIFITATSGNNVVNFGDGANQFTATTGNNTYTGGAGTDAVTVTSGNNTITTGGGIDTISVGRGLNVVSMGAANDALTITAVPVNGNIFTTVTDINVGDTINLAALTTNARTNAALGAKITLADTAAFADFLNAATAGNLTAVGALTANTMSWFQFGGNTFLVVDSTTTVNGGADTADTTTFENGIDSVVKLTGLVDLARSTTATDVLTIVA